MNLVLAILIALAPAPPATSLFVLGWTSPLPVHLTRVEVTGGALVQVLADGSGQSGTIAAEAETACLTIAAWGQTTTGIAVHLARTWDSACPRVWLPIVQGE